MKCFHFENAKKARDRLVKPEQESKLIDELRHQNKITSHDFSKDGFPYQKTNEDAFYAAWESYIERSLERKKHIYIAEWFNFELSDRIRRIYNRFQEKFPNQIHLLLGCGPHTVLVQGYCPDVPTVFLCHDGWDTTVDATTTSGKKISIASKKGVKYLQEKMGNSFLVFSQPNAIRITQS